MGERSVEWRGKKKDQMSGWPRDKVVVEMCGGN